MSKYRRLGVDPSKNDVKDAFKSIIDNDYPGAFVNIVSDPYNKNRVVTSHQDGDGSKFVQRLLNYYERGDERVFDGMVDDALSMNTSDIAASGFVFGPWLIGNILNIALPTNLKNIIMKRIARRLVELRELYHRYGFSIKFSGGETADLPDQLYSAIYDIAITAWENKKNIIIGNIQPGDRIYGFQSDGQAAWEESANSGIMSNGLTLARSSLMRLDYNIKYPNLKREGVFYMGKYYSYDHHEMIKGMSIGDAIISPTRQWPILIRMIIEAFLEKNCLQDLHGIVINTGGGATKIKNLGKGISYFKKMPIPPSIFHLIAQESRENWRNMYETFNCGVGIDLILGPSMKAPRILSELSAKVRLNLYQLGHCEKSSDDQNRVFLESCFDKEIFTY